MDKTVINKKLESLLHCLKRIEEKRPEELKTLQDNWDLQDILSVNLERAVQISVDITAIILAYKGAPTGNSMAMGFKQLEKLKVIPQDLSEKLQKSVGFRNISVHEYNTIDWSIVYDVIHNHLNNFKQFMECVLNLL